MVQLRDSAAVDEVLQVAVVAHARDSVVTQSQAGVVASAGVYLLGEGHVVHAGVAHVCIDSTSQGMPCAHGSHCREPS